MAGKIDFTSLQETLKAQFRNLNPNDPSVWPLAPKVLLALLIVAAVVGATWYLFLSAYDEQLQMEEKKEQDLRAEYSKKIAQAVNLDALKKQREQVQQYVTQLEKQLPSKAEMDALLSDINQAGLGRSLQFDLFRPGQVGVKEYYAELPIDIKVTGRYHDIGSFASDVAHLSRIVTLNNISILPAKEGAMVMEAKAKTFRYLDADEVSAQKGGKK